MLNRAKPGLQTLGSKGSLVYQCAVSRAGTVRLQMNGALADQLSMCDEQQQAKVTQSIQFATHSVKGVHAAMQQLASQPVHTLREDAPCSSQLPHPGARIANHTDRTAHLPSASAPAQGLQPDVHSSQLMLQSVGHLQQANAQDMSAPLQPPRRQQTLPRATPQVADIQARIAAGTLWKVSIEALRAYLREQLSYGQRTNFGKEGIISIVILETQKHGNTAGACCTESLCASSNP